MLEPDPPSSLDYAFNTNPNEALEAAVISFPLCKCLSVVLVAPAAVGLTHKLPLKGETRQSD